MRTLALSLMLLSPVVALVGVSEAEAAPIAEAKDRVGETIGPEAQAIIDLAAAIEADVEQGLLVLSTEGQANWAEGKKVWDEIKRLAEAEDYGGAFRTARKGRRTVRQAMRDAFEGRPSKEVSGKLKAYVEAVEPRIKALERQFENYEESNTARESFFVSRAMWQEAEKYAKRKKWDTAFRELSDALAEMDKVIYDVYPRAR